MKLENFKDKKVTRRKKILISLGVITIVGVSLLLYKTFASFSSEVSFPLMSGKVNYYGNGDILFGFYNGERKLDEMPQKDNPDNLVYERAECDNGASIEWDNEKWAPLVKGLTKTKTKCSIYFKEDKFANAGTLRNVSADDESYNGLWSDTLMIIKKLVIEPKISEKTAKEGEILYGPFNEGKEGEKELVRSYVICDKDATEVSVWDGNPEIDVNCTGYLQGNGGVKLNSDSSNLFNFFFYLKEFEGMEYLDTSNVTNMSGMFNMVGAGPASMEENVSIDLSHFDTSNVTDMSNMFNESGFKELDLSSFDTSKVTNMDNIFSRYLEKLNLSNWNINKVENIENIFEDYMHLQELNLSNWKFTDKISVNFSQKFHLDDEYLQKLILDNVDTSEVTDMSYMFNKMKSLQELDLSSFDTRNVTNMSGMFSYMNNLQSLDLRSFNTSNVTNMATMFIGVGDNGESNIQELNLSHFDTAKVESMQSMFVGAQIQNLNVSNFKFDSLNYLYSLSYIFNGNIANLNISNWKFTDDLSINFTNETGLDNANLESIILDNVDTSEVTNMSGMFYGLKNLQELDLSSFDTSKVMNMSYMFKYCSRLQELDLSHFDTSSVTDMSEMFVGVTSLTKITYGPNFIHKAEAGTSNMFGGRFGESCPANRPDGSVHPSWNGVSFD